MSKKNYTQKRDKEGKFKSSSKKKTPSSSKKSTVKKSIKKTTKKTVKSAKNSMAKVEAVLPPPIVVEQKIEKMAKETFAELKESTHSNIQKAWNKYSSSAASSGNSDSSSKIIDPDENSECYMGIHYQVVENQKHRIKLRVWNASTESWNVFTINTDPSHTEDQRREDIREVLLSATKASKKPVSSRRDIPAARSSI